MEPPAKRTKLGRVPHDAPLHDAHVDVNVNKLRSKAGKAKKTGKDETGDDDGDDEIAMDPEDYAMKVDPEYRLDRSRAVAENKLKSAFELLFEKYGQDFGDTGDEINFYTDEIEVDNGHIASLPAKRVRGRPKAAAADDDDDEGTDDDSVQDEPSIRPSRGDAARLVSLLPSRFGPGGTVIMGAGQAGHYRPGAAPPGPDAIDPTWAAPEIPELAFSTPGGYLPPPPPPRSVYAAPKRTVFTKELKISRSNDLVEDDNEDDDLGLDAPRANEKGSKKLKDSETSPVSKAAADAPKTAKKPRNRKSTAAETPAKTTADAISTEPAEVAELPNLPAADKSLPKTRRSRRQSDMAALEKTGVPNSTSPDRPLSVPGSAPLPTPLDEDAGAAEEPLAAEPSAPEAETAPEECQPIVTPEAKAKETFTRNIIDSSFVFSDDEDFGFKKRTKTQTTKLPSASPTTATAVQTAEARQNQKEAAADAAIPVESVPVVEKRRPRRPRTSSVKTEVAKEMAAEAVQSTVGPRCRMRRGEDLFIIIMTSSMPPSSEPSPAPVPATTTVSTEPRAPEEATPVPEIAATPEDEPTPPRQESTPEPELEIEPELEPEIEAEKEPEADKEQDSEPEAGSEFVPELEPEPEPERPRKRKRRQNTGGTPSSAGKARQGKRREIPDSQGNSSGIMSLVSDGSADEAEIEKIAAATPPPFSPFSSGRRPSAVPTTPSGRKQLTPSSRHRLLLATPSRQQHYARAVLGSPLARRQQAFLLASGAEAPSPGGSPIQTPGGTIRRCGKDGFRCEREFCFRCT